MNNTDEFRSTAFGKFLLESKLVAPEKEKFMVHWTRKFFEYRVQVPKLPWIEQLQLYLKEMDVANVYQPWQIRQADQAVRLYFSNFLQSSLTTGSPPASDSKAILPQDAAVQEFREALRLRHYAYRTEHSYIGWVRQYLRYCQERDSQNTTKSPCTPKLVRDFLAHLALNKHVSASTQNLAFNSLLTFFRLVFNQDLDDLKNTVRAKTGKRLPVVFSIDETRRLLEHVDGTIGLMLKLIYGGGLRVNECCRLRIKDIDFDQHLLYVRDGKGAKDRTTLLPASLISPLRAHIQRVFALHDQDLSEGYGAVWLPDALDRKYPDAARQKAWQYLFLSANRSIDPRSNTIRRHHVSDSSLQKATKVALRKAGIDKHASVHALRHSFATHLLLNGVDLRQI